MSIRGTESNVGILTAKIELDKTDNVAEILGEKYVFRDGVVTDEWWIVDSDAFGYAVSGLDFTEIAPVIAAEIERFMRTVYTQRTGDLESAAVPMMLPLASIVGPVNYPQPKDVVVWYPQYHNDCMGFVIAARGVFYGDYA